MDKKLGFFIPKSGLLYEKENIDLILCKPKLMPLRSLTLEKLEKMQQDAEKKVKSNRLSTASVNSKWKEAFWITVYAEFFCEQVGKYVTYQKVVERFYTYWIPK